MIHKTAGAQLFIGPKIVVDRTTAETALASFTSVSSWVEVRHLTDMGEIGSEAEVIVRRFIDRPNNIKKSKLPRDFSDLTIVVARDPSDPGQINMLAAEADPDEGTYALKWVVNDAPQGGTPSIYYIAGVVYSSKDNFGDVDNDTVSTTYSIAVDGEIVPQFAATAGAGE